MTRGGLLKSLVASAPLAMAGQLWSAKLTFASAPQLRAQAPGFYRMMLGDFEVTALSDGTHPFPDVAVLTKPNAKIAESSKLFDDAPGEANALLAATDQQVPTEGSINAFLINTGTKLVLIDSGAGSLYGACCGRVANNLVSAGYRAEQVDEVYLTHLHADHVGGIARDGVMAYPNAVVRARKADADYWLNSQNEKISAGFLHPMFDGDRSSLKPYREAGRFLPFDGAQELVQGISSIAAAGHTPGHTFYAVESGGEKLLLWGDVVHVPALQFPDPSICTTYDTDAAQAEATREAIFAEASRSGFWVGAAHISFPGLGHVGVQDREFVWIPANYTTRLLSPTL